LGDALGVGGHLTALRRSRVGGFDVDGAVGIDALDGAATLTPAEAAARVMPVLTVSADEARDLRHGKRLAGQRDRLTASVVAVIDTAGALAGIVEARAHDIKSAMNMPEVEA